MPSRVLQLRAPLLWLLLPFAAGLIAARHWPLPAGGPWGFLAVAGLSGLGAVWAAVCHRPAWWMAGIVLSVAITGYVALHVRFPHLHDWSSRPPREVTLVLQVDRPFFPAPAARNLGGLGTITSSVENDPTLRGRPVYYSAIRRISLSPQRSGRYLVQGVLEPLVPESEGNGFTDYLLNAGVHYRLTRARIAGEVRAPNRVQRWCTRIEARLALTLSRGLETQVAARSLYLAMLLGEKAALGTELQNAFMQSGTFHIFSISGLHVAAIAAALRILLRLAHMPQRPGIILTIVLLWIYVQITGNSSPALRAFLMIAFQLSARVFTQPANPFAALTAAALVTLLLEPLQLFSTGFQMSYAVVAALILMGRPLAENWLSRWQPFRFVLKPEWRRGHHLIHDNGRKLIGTLALTWSAFLASTPAGIGFFGLLSPGSLLANLVVVPLAGVVIYLGFFSLIVGGSGLGPVSTALNVVAAKIIELINTLLHHGVGLPGMFFNAHFRADWLAAPCLGLTVAVMLFGASTGWSRRWGGFWPPVLVLLGLLLFSVKFG